jgi:hypothetical protein
MQPSETSVGQAWLQNFAEPDVSTATMLLDGLRFVTLSTVRDGLASCLRDLVESDRLPTPAVVLPERGVADFHLSHEKERSPVAYRDFHPGEPIDITPGSEGLVGMVLRDLPGINRTNHEAPWIPPGASLEDLRAQRCRSIVLVTDYMGSGSTVIKLAEAVARHPTIRSWRSFGWLNIYAVAFASSQEALDRIPVAGPITEAWAVEAAPTFETAWAADVRDAVIAFCDTECRINKRWAQGYERSAGLFLTERNAPNNLPAVLWQTAAGWHPLFPERTVPTSFARDVGEYRSGPSLVEVAERVRQLRFGRNQRLGYMRVTSQLLLRALLFLNLGERDAAALAAELGVDIAEAQTLVSSLVQLGLVDASGRAITELGHREIDANKRGLRRTSAELAGSDAPYYPHSLR